jgi:hypothetical protein
MRLNQLERHSSCLPYFTHFDQQSMLGTKALRTCSICRDKVRSIRLVQAGPSRGINTQPDSRTIDDSVFTSHPLTDPSPGYGLNKLDGSREVEEEEENWTPREERRSPAAVFGSKRVGLEVVPRRMEENIQSEINSMSFDLPLST